MSNYTGPDRRDTPQFYSVVCHPRLQRIEDNQAVMSKSLQEVREKIFNGLSDLPRKVQYLQRTLIGLLVALLLGMATLFMQGVRASEEIKVHLEEEIGEVLHDVPADRFSDR